jgi:prefoldin subunit 2
MFRLVLETLEPLPDTRKCFRMINGVLVERTVKDVVPALKTNAEGLRKVLDDLVKQYKTKQDDLEKWKVGYSILSVVNVDFGFPNPHPPPLKYEVVN